MFYHVETTMRITLDATTLKAKFFRGFADPTRLAILEALLEGEKSVGEIAQTTEASSANVSAHLSCLTGCGLVRSEKRGKYVYYWVQERKIRDLLKIAEGILANVSQQVYECTRHQR
jgi:DNA-binding transcriptional ArsR family regulator